MVVILKSFFEDNLYHTLENAYFSVPGKASTAQDVPTGSEQSLKYTYDHEVVAPIQHNYGIIVVSTERGEDGAHERCVINVDHVSKMGSRANVLVGPIIGKVVSVAIGRKMMNSNTRYLLSRMNIRTW